MSEEKKGFGGFGDMVSDISSDITRDSAELVDSATSDSTGAEGKSATTAHPKVTPPGSPPASNSQQPAHTDPPLVPDKSSPSGSGKNGLGWVIVGVIVMGIWIANSGSGKKSQPEPTYTPPPSYTSPPLASATAPTSAPVAPISEEQKPPEGRNNVLNILQIRWCKREKIRIDAIESVINNAYDHEVDRFNAKVTDYNSRCGEFRYRRGNVEQVDRELASESASIATKAKSEWVRNSLRLEDGPASKPAPMKEKPLVQAKDKPRAGKTCQSDGECPDSQYCIRGQCGPQAATPSLSVPTPASASKKPSTPDNAYVSGSNWYCKEGFRKVGERCVAVIAPQNAYISGASWYCKEGFRQVGERCDAVIAPQNAYISGASWYCKEGFRKVGERCDAVTAPQNAYISGASWYCKEGFRKVGEQCDAVIAPPNAFISGASWYCKEGFRKVGERCIPI